MAVLLQRYLQQQKQHNLHLFDNLVIATFYDQENFQNAECIFLLLLQQRPLSKFGTPAFYETGDEHVFFDASFYIFVALFCY